MPIGLSARIEVAPEAILNSRWAHDMANAFCRLRFQIQRDYLKGRVALLGTPHGTA